MEAQTSASVWLSNCVVFIFIDQTAKFVREARVTDVAIKAELQRRTQSEGNEADRPSPPVNQMTWVLRKEASFFTTGSSKDVNHTYNFLVIQVNTHNLFVRLGPAISQGLVISLKDNTTIIEFFLISSGYWSPVSTLMMSLYKIWINLFYCSHCLLSASKVNTWYFAVLH